MFFKKKNSGGPVDFDTVLRLASDKSAEGRGELENALESLVPEEDRGRVRPHQILTKLLQQARVDMRVMLAERLAIDEKAPLELILALVMDEVEVAKPILLKSQSLKDTDLIYIVDEAQSPHWQTIAQRENITGKVVERLIETGDEITAICILDNETIHLSKTHMKALVDLAQKTETLHQPLLGRREFDNQLAARLYWAVSNELRYTLTKRFNISTQVVDEALEDLVQEMSDSNAGQHIVYENLRRVAEKYAEKEEITGYFMVNVLKRGQVAFFIALLAEKMKMPNKLARDIILYEGGRPFAVLAKAANMRKADFAAAFLLTRGNQQQQEGLVESNQLVKATAHFDKVDAQKARYLVDMWRDNEKQFYSLLTNGF